MLKPFLLILFLVIPFSVLAHSGLETSSPQDQASLTQAPTQIEMVFTAPVMLIKVELRLEGAEAVALGDDETLMTKTAHEHAVALPPLTRGRYLVLWRALGGDSHIIGGEFSFNVL